MKIIIDSVLFCVAIFAAMLAVVLVPGDSEKLLVFVKENKTDTSLYGILRGSDGRLVERLGARSFIVAGAAPGFISRLYSNGAFLVVKALPFYGCSEPLKTLPNLYLTNRPNHGRNNIILAGKLNELD